MVSLAILLLVAGVIMSAIMGMVNVQGTVSNRTEMHSAVRSATEVLQQEIGQAGRLVIPGGVVVLSTAVTSTGVATAVTFTCASGITNCTDGIFNGEQLIVDTGTNQESVALSSVSASAKQFTATFFNSHLSGVTATLSGAFASGVVPPGMTNGSSATVLKLYGDINGDGNMVYIEYTCDTNVGSPIIASVGPALYRNVMAITAASKPALTSSMVLLPNIRPNPGGTGCFTFQTKTVNINGTNTDFVVNVAVTLTVQTQNPDPQTNQYQQETKALLNVSPRNVFEVWELASIGAFNRVQPIPAGPAPVADVQNTLLP
jgi:hypothetical protein